MEIPKDETPCPYISAETLKIRIQATQSRVFDVIVLQPFAPFTLSCALLVRVDEPLLGLQGEYVLKLFDRRFATQLREDHDAKPWSREIEADYEAFLRGGTAQAFFSLCAVKDDEDFWYCQKETSWTSSHLEAYLQFCCLKQYSVEKAVYERLHDLQGECVPRVAACVSLEDRSQDSSMSDNLDCPGILMEYIRGFSLTDLDQFAPPDAWQAICEEAIRIINEIRSRDIRNEDVKTRSFIVREVTTAPPQVVMLDFGACVLRKDDQDDEDWDEWKAQQDEEGAIGLVMERKLKGGFKYQRTAETMRLLDKYMRE